MLDGKRILLVIGGGIAAYKCLELTRRLKEAGARVRIVLSQGARHFVTPLSASAINGGDVHTELFDLVAESEIGHIRLARDCDLVVVAPATADLMAKMATGQAADLATAVLLATGAPVLLAPAMNPHMWRHPATQRNLARLLEDGASTIGPNVGEMAEPGESGLGRMAEPAEILAAVIARLTGSAEPGPLSGRRVLVTAGPTHEPIDPVRYIANRSSGRQGYAIAAAAAAAGAETVLVSGPVALPTPEGVRRIEVESAGEMLAACEAALPVDIAIFAAAVADWRVKAQSDHKLKKDASGPPTLSLAENPDILATIAKRHDGRPGLVVGFAAETDDVIENASKKLARKGCDLVVANDVSPGTGIMGGTRNLVHLVSATGVETWPEMSKAEVADRLVARFAALVGAQPRAAE